MSCYLELATFRLFCQKTLELTRFYERDLRINHFRRMKRRAAMFRCHGNSVAEKNCNGLPRDDVAACTEIYIFIFPISIFEVCFHTWGAAPFCQPENARFGDIEYAILKKICE